MYICNLLLSQSFQLQHSPDSKEFILEELDQTYAILGDYFKLLFVPFGNASTDSDSKTVECQHGDFECSGNSYEQCSIFLYPNPDAYLPYVSCLASLSNDELEEELAYENCAEKASLDWPSIKNCHDNEELSWKLQLKA